MYRILHRDELTGHDYFELAPGRLPPCWGAGSVYLCEEDLTWLLPALKTALPRFNYYGPNLLFERDWRHFMAWFAEAAPTPDARALLAALDAYAVRAFLTHAALTLYGV